MISNLPPRRHSLARWGWALAAIVVAAGVWTLRAAPSAGRVDAVWGQRGLLPGEFIKPRAIAFGRNDEVFVVDMKAMIQVYTTDGEYRRGWQSPDHKIGRPSGLGIDRDGNLLCADSHYHRVLVYSPDGKILREYGGHADGVPLKDEFGYIADVEEDAEGDLYIAESQQNERITKIDRDGKILARWGVRGYGPGEFQRIRSLFFDSKGELYVADACNHRIQVFDRNGKHLRSIGEGLLHYPYDVAVRKDGVVCVVEWGAERVQRFAPDGVLLGTWGGPGRKEGLLARPWALGLDSRGRLYVVDSENHRIQRVRFDD